MLQDIAVADLELGHLDRPANLTGVGNGQPTDGWRHRDALTR